MTTIVLDTTGLQAPVTIHAFQFGTVPAREHSYELKEHSVCEGRSEVEIFTFEHHPVSEGNCVRFDLRFEVNIHNSANLQVVMSTGDKGSEILWRWSAPLGLCGFWTDGAQTAPWSDDNMNFSLDIRGTQKRIHAALTSSKKPDANH